MITAFQIQEFLKTRYADEVARLKIDSTQLNDDFDFLSQGIIDSLGVLEMVNAIEERFNITVDLEGLDAEQLTVLGPLSKYIEKKAVSR